MNQINFAPDAPAAVSAGEAVPHKWAKTGKHHGGRAGVIAMGGMLVAVLFALFSPAAPFSLAHGLLFLWVGLLMAAVPPDTALPRLFSVAAVCFAGFSALCFLPAAVSGVPSWRTALENAGLDTGRMVTAHPAQTRESLALHVIMLLAGLFTISHRVRGRVSLIFALLFAVGVGAYIIVSILCQEMDWTLLWDSEPSFGLFPNRNHTATLLAMGTVVSASLVFYGAQKAHGIVAGVASLSLVLCLWALAGYNLSRAGVVLSVAGLIGWVAGLGRAWISGRVLLAAAFFAVAVTGVFVASNSGLKERFAAPLQQKPSGVSGVDDIPRTATADGEAFDFRWLLYQDTLSMIGDSPVTGSGDGMFRYVFPQYRKMSSSSNNSLVLHPESDWLMVAAESGVPAAVSLAVAVAGLFAAAFCGGRGSHHWPLRLGCLIAAAIVPLHGVFDVPGHRVGLAWASVFLVSIALQDFGRHPSRPALHRWFWRLAGAGIATAGLTLCYSNWTGSPALAMEVPERLAGQARDLYHEDQEAQKQGAVNPPADGPDRLEVAIGLLEEAVRVAPLDPELHYLRGTLALMFTDKESLAGQSYLIERLLDPAWVRLPLRQSRNWAAVDPVQAAVLWRDAMKRSEKLEALAPATFMNRGQVFREIMRQAPLSEALSREAAVLAGEDPGFRMIWANAAHPGALRAVLPGWLTESGSGRAALFENWLQRDGKGAGEWLEALHNQ